MRAFLNSLAAGLLLLALPGCKTDDEAHTGQMASVEISGHTRGEIEQATATAFQANGYQKVDKWIFEKPGSTWETLNYGGWSSDHVWIRMKLVLTSLDTRKFWLGCDAYVVEGHDEPTPDIERKFLFAKRSECKQILDEIKTALASPPPTPDAGSLSPP